MFIVKKLIDIFAREDTTFFSFLSIFSHFFCYFCNMIVNIHTHSPKKGELTLSTIGIHPYDAEGASTDSIFAIERVADHYDAIGEIGLDYYWDKTYKQEQQQALRQQLLLAKELNLPVILHNRESTEDIIRIVREVQADTTSPNPLRGVFHCFTGSKETAQQIIQMGFYLGIGGVITFKNCKLSDNLVDVPLDRILLETDAPYMAPVPHRGKRNESRWMSFVANKLAEVYSTTPTTIIEATTRNACTLFGLKCAKN